MSQPKNTRKERAGAAARTATESDVTTAGTASTKYVTNPDFYDILVRGAVAAVKEMFVAIIPTGIDADSSVGLIRHAG
jgi:hypothetical protein